MLFEGWKIFLKTGLLKILGENFEEIKNFILSQTSSLIIIDSIDKLNALHIIGNNIVLLKIDARLQKQYLTFCKLLIQQEIKVIIYSQSENDISGYTVNLHQSAIKNIEFPENTQKFWSWFEYYLENNERNDKALEIWSMFINHIKNPEPQELFFSWLKHYIKQEN